LPTEQGSACLLLTRACLRGTTDMTDTNIAAMVTDTTYAGLEHTRGPQPDDEHDPAVDEFLARTLPPSIRNHLDRPETTQHKQPPHTNGFPRRRWLMGPEMSDRSTQRNTAVLALCPAIITPSLNTRKIPLTAEFARLRGGFFMSTAPAAPRGSDTPSTEPGVATRPDRLPSEHTHPAHHATAMRT